MRHLPCASLSPCRAIGRVRDPYVHYLACPPIVHRFLPCNACDTHPHHPVPDRRHRHVVQNWRTTYKELKGWKHATPSDDLARGNWWAPFRDSRLDALLREVEISNQTVAAAAAAYEQSRAIITEAQSALFPTGHPHADRSARRHHRRQRRRLWPRHPIHDPIFRTDQRRLGPRRLGQGPPHHRSRHVGGAGERGRSGQCQTVGAGPACHRLFQSPCGGFTARSAASRCRAIPRNLRITLNKYKALRIRLRIARDQSNKARVPERRAQAQPHRTSGHCRFGRQVPTQSSRARREAYAVTHPAS